MIFPIFIIVYSFIGALLLDIFLHSTQFPGLLFFILHILIVGGGLFFWLYNNSIQNRSIVPPMWLIISLCISPWLFIRDSVWMHDFNILTTFALVMLFWVNAFADKISPLIISFFAVPIHFFIETFTQVTQPLQHVFKRYSIFKKMNWSVLRTFIFAFPVLCIMYLLLSSADTIFRQYAKNFFSFFDFFDGHILLIFYFFWFCGFFYALVRHRTQPQIHTQNILVRQKSIFRMIAIFSILLLAVFSWIQIRYLFLNSAAIQNLGINYQTYAHQGFYQLMIVALIVFSTLWLLGKKKSALPHTDTVSQGDEVYVNFETVLSSKDKIITAILLIEIIILLSSAMKRVWLFATELEWAPQRFFAFEGMIFFLIILLLFTVHVYKKDFRRQHFLIAFSFLFVINIFILNCINPDQWIAKQNVSRYVYEGGEEYELDFDYSAYVSADGIEEGLLLFDNARTEKEKHRAAVSLQKAWEELQMYASNKDTYWYQIHFAKEHAYYALKERILEIRKYSS